MALRSERKWKKKRNRKKLTKADERLERHIQKQKAKIMLEARKQALLSLKRRCFPSSVFFGMPFENG